MIFSFAQFIAGKGFDYAIYGIILGLISYLIYTYRQAVNTRSDGLLNVIQDPKFHNWLEQAVDKGARHIDDELRKAKKRTKKPKRAK
ncbi:hypothetical protein HY989_04210 [Candidatus Micrarchaeota archaeon]|nr:hypothetical protein [Candidatus Micrarchaeota archaeon]